MHRRKINKINAHIQSAIIEADEESQKVIDIKEDLIGKQLSTEKRNEIWNMFYHTTMDRLCAEAGLRVIAKE